MGNTIIPNLAVDYVIEEGSNANGYYRKWANGTLECWQRTTVNVAVNSAYGSAYLGGWSWNFPMAFSDHPVVTCSEFKWGTGASWGGVVGVGTTHVNLEVYDLFSRASGSCVVSVYAIGHWN